ncbi:MAG TPA: ATP-binding protein [Fimbriimonadaceae bacterium]|nr:ATP-binding protein [Fimbriimonadaceae bacterium]
MKSDLTSIGMAHRKISGRPVATLAPEAILVGKDVLELLSSAMYVDPLSVYREYVQNAADAIDDARREGLLRADEAGRVDFSFDSTARSVRIRDNGTGIPCEDFVRVLTSIGGSSKRGTQARGFRGVGRLAGLAYAQELVFRSRAVGETMVSEMRWDCRRLKSAMRATDFSGGLEELIRHVVTGSQIEPTDYPERFFEVELRGIVRLRSDKLMTPSAVEDFLSQVAPVPFAPEFGFGAEISAALQAVMPGPPLHIHIAGSDRPVYRPHRDTFDVGGGRLDRFEEVEIVHIPAMDGGRAALVWVLHHGYEGAIPASNLVKGLRLRVGNIQIGDTILLEELFAEPRFNSWSVGEVHVLDSRIVPNARRDNFEQNAHWNNLVNQLGPIAREISRRCRSSSIRRNWLRRFELADADVAQSVGAMSQPMSDTERQATAVRADAAIKEMRRIAGMRVLVDQQNLLTLADKRAEELVEARAAIAAAASPLEAFPPHERAVWERCFGLIRECSVNRVAAGKLIDRIVQRAAAPSQGV